MRAFLTGAERIEVIARMAAVYGVMALLFVLDIIAAPHPLTIFFSVPFSLMMLYYWSVHRPSFLPLWLAFIAGFVMDALGGFPLGLNALLYMLIRIFLVNQRRFLLGQGFMVSWIGFASLNVTFHILLWAVLSVYNMTILPLDDLLLPVLLGSLAFPVISAFLNLTHKILLSNAGE